MSQPVSVELSSAPARSHLDDDTVLGVVSFGTEPIADPRTHRMPLETLAEPHCEIWRSSRGPVRSGTHGPLRYATDGDVLFGSLSLADDGSRDLADLGREAYTLLLDWLETRPECHVWRIWNILRDITAGDGDNERYRRFVLGRHDVLRTRGWPSDRYPAATAIGGAAPELFIMFMTGKQPSRQVENPRQVSAFHYPRQYGPRSPSFARAAIAPADGDGRSLFVSGTASVVGHASHHVDDVAMQLQETLNNVRTLLDNTGKPAHARALKVFIRDPADTPQILTALRDTLGPDAPLVALHGDICREELMLEIEGVWSLDDA